jgi:hypothetical protein
MDLAGRLGRDPVALQNIVRLGADRVNAAASSTMTASINTIRMA